MESNNKNKFIVVSYALYDVTKGNNGEEMLIERTTDERPFFFISGMGVTLPAFEEKIVDLGKGRGVRLRVGARAGLWSAL